MTRLVTAVLLVVSACGGKGEEDDALAADGKADTLRSPTFKGGLAAGVVRPGTLDADAGFHAWTFVLGDDAEVTVETAPGPDGAALDTVLYLYRRTHDRWGAYLAKNDDGGPHAAAGFSRIRRKLGSGVYRAVVKGYRADDRGDYRVRASGFSSGCAFGTTFRDLTDQSPVHVVQRTKLFADDIGALEPWEPAQIVRALHASSHDEVVTVADAFAAADQGEINRVTLVDDVGGRRFRAYEYGAGDNSYGALFAHAGAATPLAEIHDGDLEGCTAELRACLFGSGLDGVNGSGLLDATGTTTLTATSPLAPALAAQVLAAVGDHDSAAQAIAAVDGGELTVHGLRDPRDGKTYRWLAFYQGDTQVGAVFEGDDATVLAEIDDGEVHACTRRLVD
jgi:hypothetical protein